MLAIQGLKINLEKAELSLKKHKEARDKAANAEQLNREEKQAALDARIEKNGERLKVARTERSAFVAKYKAQANSEGVNFEHVWQDIQKASFERQGIPPPKKRIKVKANADAPSSSSSK
mmetsp:Transcript_7178/g.18835  ORF Transcript_7178/g.18835 Transcript_7178/m.18835 type:complete len:119 (+) Transcript_7178:1097-1453(+)